MGSKVNKLHYECLQPICSGLLPPLLPLGKKHADGSPEKLDSTHHLVNE